MQDRIDKIKTDLSILRNLAASMINHELFNRSLRGQAEMIIQKVNDVESQIDFFDFKSEKGIKVEENKNPPTLVPSPSNVHTPSTSFDNKEPSDEVKNILAGLNKPS